MFKLNRQRITLKTVIVVCVIFTMLWHLFSLLTKNTDHTLISANGDSQLSRHSRTHSPKHAMKDSSQVTCADAVTKVLDDRITDSLLTNVARLCLKHKVHNVTDSDTFKRLLSVNSLRYVTCPVIGIGPPDKPRDLVALAGVAGSGTSWVRHLIEQISGVQTGSLYNRDAYRFFPGESKCPTRDAMFIVKTNEFGASLGRMFKPECRRVGMRDVTFDKAVYVLRNPFNMISANYDHRNHLLYNDTLGLYPAGDVFLKPQWRSVIRQQSQHWLKHVAWWLESFKQPVHVIVYENLIQQTQWELLKLFNFLDYPVTLRSIICVNDNLEGALYKPADDWMSHDTLFMPETTVQIVDTVKKISPLLARYNTGEDIIHSYYRFDENND